MRLPKYSKSFKKNFFYHFSERKQSFSTSLIWNKKQKVMTNCKDNIFLEDSDLASIVSVPYSILSAKYANMLPPMCRLGIELSTRISKRGNGVMALSKRCHKQ